MDRIPARRKKLVRDCAEYARLAYKDIDDSFSITEESTDCVVYMWTNERTLFVTGPGSVSMRDWCLDLQVWRRRVPYLGGTLVHAGFARVYDSVRERVLAKARETSKGYDRVVCTGHSLFGAVATLAAADLATELGEVPVVCVTFGSPRVGDEKFVEYFHGAVDASHRCVVRGDPVAATPTKWRFKHVGGELRCGPRGLCSARKHSMDAYVDGLSEPEKVEAVEEAEPESVEVQVA